MSCIRLVEEEIEFLATRCENHDFSYYWNNDWKGGNRAPLLIACIAEILDRENYESCCSRYPHRKDEPFTSLGYDLSDRWLNASAIETIKAIHFYMYQTCESPNWKKSEAKAICDAIERYFIREIEGYEYSRWGVPLSGFEKRKAEKEER